MAYHGCYPFMLNILKACYARPIILEIGIDKGQTLIPLMHHLRMNYPVFSLHGVDIKIRDELKIILHSMSYDTDPEKQIITIDERNSLEAFPEIGELLGERTKVFDMILLDGDHNYYTVQKELFYSKDFLAPGGLIIADDYDIDSDEYFASAEGYEDNELATSVRQSDEGGVRRAVDEFLDKNPDFDIFKPFVHYEPVFLYRKGEWAFMHGDLSNTHERQCDFHWKNLIRDRNAGVSP